MMDRSKIEMELRLIERLYDEAEGAASADRIRTRRPDLQSELEAFQETKAALDARRKQRPDPRSVEAILDEARRAVSAVERDRGRIRRPDRSPQSRRSSQLRSAGVITAFLVVFVGILTVWRSDVIDSPVAVYESEPTAALGERADADTKARNDDSDRDDGADSRTNEANEMIAEADEGARDPVARRESEMIERRSDERARLTAQGSRSVYEDSQNHVAALSDGDPLVLLTRRENDNDGIAWDEGEDFIEVHQQIEMIRGGVALGWDPPSVPLEMPPSSDQVQGAPPSYLMPAGEQRRP